MNSAPKWGFLEREAESLLVSRALKRASERQGGMLLVEGAAGVGKSRLLEEAREAALASGFTVGWARATELDSDFAFGVVCQLFEPLVIADRAEHRGSLMSGPAVQASSIFPQSGPSSASPVGDLAMLHGLYWLTVNSCQRRPLILLIDDLQWSDNSSLRYLAYLLPRAEELPLVVVAALRSGEVSTDENLIRRITADPSVKSLRPKPLSLEATGELLQGVLLNSVNPDFTAACHRATRGNPLLLRELVRTVQAEGMSASAENAELVQGLGARAVARLVEVRMSLLSKGAVQLAQAASIIGDHAELSVIARMTGHDTIAALDNVSALERLEILRTEYDGEMLRLTFVHPLVKAAVHDSINLAELAAGHLLAARLLTDVRADPERVAAHLLRVPATADVEVVDALRAAAEQALRRGSPESAHTYLRRALHELPRSENRVDLLIEAGAAASMVDLPAAGRYLHEALELTHGSGVTKKAEIAFRLGLVRLFQLRLDEALRLQTQAFQELPADAVDLRQRVLTEILGLGWHLPIADIPEQLETARRLPSVAESAGTKMVQAVVGTWDALLGNPAAVPLVERVLQDGALISEANGSNALAVAWMTLAAADRRSVIDSIEVGLSHAHRKGSTYALSAALTFRGLSRLGFGELSEAESDLSDARRAAEQTQTDIARPITGAWLIQALLPQGKTEQAAEVLTWVNASDPVPEAGLAWSLLLMARAEWHYACGLHEKALSDAMAAGERFTAIGGKNPAFVPWRSEAARALHALQRDDEARSLALEEIRLARRWEAPKALGRSLRIASQLYRGPERLSLLHESIAVLEHSSVRMEYAYTLLELGIELRLRRRIVESRVPLRKALDIATSCNAPPLADRIRTELRAAGGRPRRSTLTGPKSLTPSEYRIADMASRGATNNQIAQQLYITPKTVEVHLTSIYRKLEIGNRRELPHALGFDSGLRRSHRMSGS